LEQRARRYPADGKFLRTVEKLAAINAAMHVAVKQVQEFLGEVRGLLSIHRNIPGYSGVAAIASQRDPAPQAPRPTFACPKKNEAARGSLTSCGEDLID